MGILEPTIESSKVMMVCTIAAVSILSQKCLNCVHAFIPAIPTKLWKLYARGCTHVLWITTG